MTGRLQPSLILILIIILMKHPKSCLYQNRLSGSLGFASPLNSFLQSCLDKSCHLASIHYGVGKKQERDNDFYVYLGLPISSWPPRVERKEPKPYKSVFINYYSLFLMNIKLLFQQCSSDETPNQKRSGNHALFKPQTASK